MANKFRKIFLIIVIGLFLSNCRTLDIHKMYEGPRLEKDKIAMIYTDFYGLRINTLNGKEFYSRWDGTTKSPVGLEVNPGLVRGTFSIDYVSGNRRYYGGPVAWGMKTETGHRYLLFHKVINNKIKPYYGDVTDDVKFKEWLKKWKSKTKRAK